MEDFDISSFRMRYPIAKNLDQSHEKSVKLDTIHLHTKMTELFKLFDQIDYSICNLIRDNTCYINFEKKIYQLYSDCKKEIGHDPAANAYKLLTDRACQVHC